MQLKLQTQTGKLNKILSLRLMLVPGMFLDLFIFFIIFGNFKP